MEGTSPHALDRQLLVGAWRTYALATQPTHERARQAGATVTATHRTTPDPQRRAAESVQLDSEIDLVFVHGLAGDATTWGPVAARLPPTVHWLSVDLPGHGKRRGDDGPFTVARFADAVLDDIEQAANLDRESERPLLLVGHSLGGAVCVEVAAATVGRPVHVLAIDSLLNNELYAAQGALKLMTYRSLLKVAYKPFLAAVLRKSYTKHTPDSIKRRTAQDFADLPATVFIQAFLSLAEWDRAGRLARCGSNVGITAFPATDSPPTAQSIETSRVAVRPVAYGGHFYVLMLPDVVAGLLLDFIAQLPATPTNLG
ncbi:alpha/beta hydrolase [Streptomyces humidus]|uniref:Alpha/beta hydrolase n=1 Tax=Streptomyces humidus TaxID=52259 RepID=A0A918GHE5_9ACTN|nr:alpha/beta fold hydrolase [Streptomyces humidus]GGS32742.1 alpha/beta hydrolase [Streptomyces humidus]